MITTEDLKLLYHWSKNNSFPLKQAITSYGYSNNPISFCWIKKVMKTKILRETIISNLTIQKILENEDILFSMFVVFDSGTKLGPHKDPNIYREPYKRIQIPLEIPDNEKCYMIWKGKKICWSVGEPQVFEVMDYIHEGYNLSNDSMKFLFIDVKKETQVEIK